MNIVKAQAINVIKNLPDEVTWDDVMYHLYVKKKIDISLDALQKGKVYNHEDVKKRIMNNEA